MMPINKKPQIKPFALAGFLLGCLFSYAQSSLPLKDSTYLFWQPELKISASDYKAAPNSATKPAIAIVAIWAVMDLPKEPTGKQPKIYIAPVFDRSFSSTITSDPVDISKENVYFDMCEIWARWAREKMSAIQDSITNTDSLSNAFIAVIKEMNEHRLRMYRKYTREVFREKKENAFDEWTQTINKTLADTKVWSTKPEECSRFKANKPIEEGYTEDPRSNPPVFGDTYEQVLQNDTWHGIFSQITRNKP